jgi:type IX secretion system PorP/SprF family membrane protein
MDNRVMTTIEYSSTVKNFGWSIYKYLLLLLFILIANYSTAQLNPYQGVYFQNRYLNNPAMAGLSDGLTLNLGYMQQWNSFPGEPQSAYLTAEYQATDKVGAGLNIINNQSGVFQQTRIMGSYAYHLPLDDQNQKLNFGLSFGVNDSRINYSVVNADLTDNILAQYNNNTKPNIDGDLGLSYTNDNLFIEGVLPNLSTTIFNRDGQANDIDQTVFFTAISYKFDLSGENSPFSIEPLAAYRKIKGFTNIFDAGFNFNMNNYHIDLQAIYHSNGNYGIGIALDEQTYAINFVYDISTGPISTYDNGTFEVGLRLNLFNNGSGNKTHAPSF